MSMVPDTVIYVRQVAEIAHPKFTFDNRSRDMVLVSVYSTSDPSVEENGQRREAIEFQ